ncbi:MAG: D-aminoacyl-tRNA deacylase [Desulfopila sp.]
MRAVVQRAAKARVTAEGTAVGAIGSGMVVLLGIHPDDGEREIRWMADKIVNLRIFADEKGKMNRSLKETGGEMLVVSQFTLYADCRKGRRPGYSAAAPPEIAEGLYHAFVTEIKRQGIRTATGIFQASMQVALVNDGPVTLLLDSAKHF